MHIRTFCGGDLHEAANHVCLDSSQRGIHAVRLILGHVPYILGLRLSHW